MTILLNLNELFMYELLFETLPLIKHQEKRSLHIFIELHCFILSHNNSFPILFPLY